MFGPHFSTLNHLIQSKTYIEFVGCAQNFRFFTSLYNNTVNDIRNTTPVSMSWCLYELCSAPNEPNINGSAQVVLQLDGSPLKPETKEEGFWLYIREGKGSQDSRDFIGFSLEINYWQ